MNKQYITEFRKERQADNIVIGSQATPESLMRQDRLLIIGDGVSLNQLAMCF